MEEILRKLEEIDSLSIQDGISKHHIEIRKNESETIVSANKPGLVWLALELLKLAEQNTVGSHLHIDEITMADKAETNLVISLNAAE